jgi:hypothetical protein
MKKLLLKALLLFALTPFLQCSDDDSSKASFDLSVDGTSVKVTNPSGVLSFTEEYGHEGRGLLVMGQIGEDQVTVTVSNWDFQNPPENGVLAKSYSSAFDEEMLEEADCLELEGDVTLCEGVLITYTTNGDTFFSAFSDTYNGTVEITKCSDNKISGKFDLKAKSLSDETEVTLQGNFSNIKYVVY